MKASEAKDEFIWANKDTIEKEYSETKKNIMDAIKKSLSITKSLSSPDIAKCIKEKLEKEEYVVTIDKDHAKVLHIDWG